MRGGIDGLPSAHPLSGFLPALLQEDDFTGRWMEGLDGVIAPLLWTLDSLEAYFDPRVAPPDFLQWLAGWVGAVPDHQLDEGTQRALVAETAELYATRGTVEGLRRLLQLTTPAEVLDIQDEGAVSWSLNPSEAIPVTASARRVLTVRIRGGEDEQQAVRDLVRAWCPAHVPFRVEVEGA